MNHISERAAKLASYMDLFDRLEDPIFLIEPDNFQILDCNNSAELFFKKNQDELLKFNFMELFKNEDVKENFHKELRRSKRKYFPQKIDVEWEINSVHKYLEITLCPLDLNDGKKVIQMLIKDVTQLVESSKSLELKNIELNSMNKKLEEISITDELTQLYNVRYFNNMIKLEHERSERHNLKYSLILFDVDNFKNYNDTNGHIEGDSLLKELAQVIKKSVRNIDIPARYGGEEFVVICPETNSDEALIVAERIRKAVMNYDFNHKEKQPLKFVSVSIGIATFGEDDVENPLELKKLADEALYFAKHNGRNQSKNYGKIAS